ncbi:MAG: hypothetical protein KDC27_01960 [Acidobacteria bacterium]|nr:hypothetical protein [Acidobacteriota bacterium]
MYLPVLRQISHALKTLNPNEVQSMANRPIEFGVLAADDQVAAEIFSFLLPPELSQSRVREAGKRIIRISSEDDFSRCNLGFAEPGVPHPAHFYRFDPFQPTRSAVQMLDEHEDDALALARWFPAFRDEVTERTIWKVCKENALFTVATAIPNVVPSWISVPWAAGEFASDTAFLTMNQVRMAFLLAAASDREVGYAEQKGQIGGIVAAAFGWRALARELVGKIPAGGGLVSKGLVSFAGTYAVGKGLDRFFRFGKQLTRSERRDYYDHAYDRGRSAVQEIVDRFRTHKKPVNAIGNG